MRNTRWAAALLAGFVLCGPGRASAGSGIEIREGLPDLSFSASTPSDLGPIPLAASLPRFDQEVPATRDLTGRDVAAWQKATVIVVVPGGFGSGAIVSGDGWVLTNYHVVEGPLQQAASLGNLPVVVEIITCEITDKGPRRRTGTMPARVFRVDPMHDLALLKIDGKAPAGAWPHLTLHTAPVAVQSECFAVGSQGGGIPWAVRRGNVTILGTYPFGFTEFVVGAVDSAQVAGLRQRLDMIITSCEISSGDSGGPLVNAAGQLIGLTFATPVNLSTGAVGFHIAGGEIADFLKPLPETPEDAPFDPWLGGVAAASHGQPRIEIFQVDNQNVQSLQYPLLGQRGEGFFPVASALFLDFGNRNALVAGRDPAPALSVPAGLWGMGATGAFQFDAFVVCRADSVLAVGYVGADNTVDEIRIDTNRDGMADHRWRRKASRWNLDQPFTLLSLTDAMRLGGGQRADMIDSILNGCGRVPR